MSLVDGGPHHYCVVSDEPAAFRRFYVDTLGLKPDPDRDWVFIAGAFEVHECAVTDIAAGEPDGWQEFPALTAITAHNTWRDRINHLSFSVSDVCAVANRLMEEGYECFGMDDDGNRFRFANKDDCRLGLGTCFVYDPSGNLVEFGEIDAHNRMYRV